MSGTRSEPTMNITNQINAGLNDVRSILIDISDFAKTPDISDRIKASEKAMHTLEMINIMIRNHRDGVMSRPWSDMRELILEEFDE